MSDSEQHDADLESHVVGGQTDKVEQVTENSTESQACGSTKPSSSGIDPQILSAIEIAVTSALKAQEGKSTVNSKAERDVDENESDESDFDLEDDDDEEVAPPVAETVVKLVVQRVTQEMEPSALSKKTKLALCPANLKLNDVKVNTELWTTLSKPTKTRDTK